MALEQKTVPKISVESENIFTQYTNRKSVFVDKKALSSSFIPDKIPHRDGEIEQISAVLAPVLKGYDPNNIFIYGTCGTGKTICTKFIVKQLADVSDGSVVVIYVNCKMKKVADTEYRLFAQLLKELGEQVPDTGLPTDVLYRRFFSKIEQMGKKIILILDEIDALVKKVGDEFLYNLTRINTDMADAHVTIIGITNDLSLRENMDMRVKSTLSEEEVLFKPYNAIQLKDILEERVDRGFVEGAVNQEVVSKCAALAAQEHGDARRALDLLRVSGELAERMGETDVREKHVDIAEQKIDMDRVTETVKSQPTQSQAVLYAITQIDKKISDKKDKWRDRRILTGDVYTHYKKICADSSVKPLTQRRISDLIGELDMLGIITANVVSKGRYGRTREISLAISSNVLERIEGFLAAKLFA